MAWLSDWKKRIKLSTDHTKIDENLTNFPVMLNLNKCNVEILFDELGYGSVDDDFTGSNGDVPNSELWTENDSLSIADIQNNKLNVVASGVGDKACAFTSKYNLTGDFDIQIDFDVTTLDGPVSSVQYANILKVYDGTKTCAFGRVHVGGGGSNGYYKDGTDDGWVSHVNADASGKLRIIRSGSTIKCYYWHSSQWEWDGNTAGYTFITVTSEDVSVQLWTKQESGSDLNTNYDNFTINFGSIVWPQGTYPNRKKIAITKEDGVTQCYAEIEHFDNILKNIILWSKIPTVISGSNTVIYLYIDVNKSDNTTYVGDVGSTPAQNVWDENFVGVWHMSQDPSGGVGCIKDSTSNSNDGTASGTMTSEDLVDGKIGKALDFDGSDDYLDRTDNAFLSITGALTLESTFKTDLASDTNNRGVVAKYTGTNDDRSYALVLDYVTDNNNPKLHIAVSPDGTSGAAKGKSGSTSLDTVSTYYGAGVFTPSTKLEVFLNGSSDGSLEVDIPAAIDDNASALWIGSFWRTTSTEVFNGIIDEVRISNITRSAPWIKATYYSNWDQLITYEPYYQLYKYYFAGYTFEDSEPVSRIVRAYVSSTGWLAGEATSSGITGYYELNVSTSGSHYLVCMDAEELPDYNNLIISKATPYVNG